MQPDLSRDLVTRYLSVRAVEQVSFSPESGKGKGLNGNLASGTAGTSSSLNGIRFQYETACSQFKTFKISNISKGEKRSET